MYRKEIEQYIDEHKDFMLEDIKTLCRINSEKMPYEEGKPFGKGPFSALISALDMASDYGFTIKNYDNYAGSIDLSEAERQLDILAHVDVVPAGEGWTETTPFDPVVKGDKIFGRGTADDKGPAVAALYAMRAVKELGIPLKKSARLILGTDEECGSGCLQYYMTKEKSAPMSFSPDGEYPVVNIEKGRLPGHFTATWDDDKSLPRLVSIEAGTKINVVPPKAKAVIEGLEIDQVQDIADKITAQTGVTFTYDLEPVFEITAHGKNAHASTPEQGVNAITGLLLLINSLPLKSSKKTDTLKNLYDLMPHLDTTGEHLGIAAKDEESGALSLAFSLLHVDDKGLDGSFDVRSPLCVKADELLKKCRDAFAKAGMTFDNTDMTEPHKVASDSELVKTLLKCYEEYTGLKGSCIAIGGGTYVHEIEGGVAFGAAFPGTDNRMHGPDEFAVISELVASAKIFAQVIVDLCS